MGEPSSVGYNCSAGIIIVAMTDQGRLNFDSNH